jgi:hypothetical protein
VWNRQRKDEVLIDVQDVALGHTTKMRWNEQGSWIWSEQQAHEPLIDVATFEQVQPLRRARCTPRPYVLRGLLYCGVCDRRMQGSWNNHAPYYRCIFLDQYAAKNKIDHPRAVYLREDQILPGLDCWPARKFGPHALPLTLRELAEAKTPAQAMRWQRRPGGRSPRAMPSSASTAPPSKQGPTRRSSPVGWPRYKPCAPQPNHDCTEARSAGA